LAAQLLIYSSPLPALPPSFISIWPSLVCGPNARKGHGGRRRSSLAIINDSQQQQQVGHDINKMQAGLPRFDDLAKIIAGGDEKSFL
jgi:hypothetical protein